VFCCIDAPTAEARQNCLCGTTGYDILHGQQWSLFGAKTFRFRPAKA